MSKLDRLSKTSPCIPCKPPERQPGCHDHCERWKEWKAIYDAEAEIVWQERKKYSDGIGVAIDIHRRHRTIKPRRTK